MVDLLVCYYGGFGVGFVCIDGLLVFDFNVFWCEVNWCGVLDIMIEGLVIILGVICVDNCCVVLFIVDDVGY